MLDASVLLQDAADLAARALAEDGDRDITSLVSVPDGLLARADLEVRTESVLAGQLWADAVARRCGLEGIEWRFKEGDKLQAGSIAGTIAGTMRGSLRAILHAERTLLNVLQRASGIATATRGYVNAVAHTSARILHTRKTAPGLRLLDVAGVIAGGGHTHRLDLARIVMIKDNHWKALAAGGSSLAAALASARAQGADELFVEVESLGQVDEACDAGATRLLIDNQAPATVANWGSRARGRRTGIEIEATGGITLENVSRFAQAAADFISIGALTHSVRAADISLEVRGTGNGMS
jgi:nicotinate-nucleotide pyrophosphorylase (carboxylating)